MNKRSQITLFIILGIVILVGALFYFIFINQSFQFGDTAGMDPQIQSVTNYVGSCVDSAFRRGLYLSAARGGVIYSEGYTLFAGSDQFTYYNYYSNLRIPDEDKIESDILRFVEEDILYCLNDMDVFADQGLSFDFGEISGEVFLGDTSFLVLDWPIVITSIESKSTISEFSAEEPIKYREMYEMAKTVALIDSSSNDFIFPDTGRESLSIRLFPYDSETIIFVVTDKSYVLPMVFRFASRKSPNSPPRIEQIPNFILRQGENFVYQVEAHDPEFEDIYYFADDPRVLIDRETGMINFTPDFTGYFITNIRAWDIDGSEDVQTVRFEVYPSDDQDRIIIDEIDMITIYMQRVFRFPFPALSTKGEKLTCESDMGIVTFDDDCVMTLPSIYNIVPGNFSLTVTVRDESGYEKSEEINIKVIEHLSFLVEPISRIFAVKGIPKTYQINIERFDDPPFGSYPLNYTEDSQRFDITDGGLITIYSQETGTFQEKVIISDVLGYNKEEDFELVINDFP